jgi:Mn-dependent DtxR family transcriptional regulator
MKDNDEQRGLSALEALYELARADIPATLKALAHWLDTPEPQLRDLLIRLDAQGLVDAHRTRLTMKGLVLALSKAGTRKQAKRAA